MTRPHFVDVPTLTNRLNIGPAEVARMIRAGELQVVAGLDGLRVDLDAAARRLGVDLAPLAADEGVA